MPLVVYRQNSLALADIAAPECGGAFKQCASFPLSLRKMPIVNCYANKRFLSTFCADLSRRDSTGKSFTGTSGSLLSVESDTKQSAVSRRIIVLE